MKITGAELFVKALKKEHVDTLFAYLGGQAIDLFDALYGEKDIEVILPRHEQGLVHAADGYARSTGKVGVCLVTSGPGATNLVTGIATANYDSVPLVCFTGQVSTNLIGNDAFQEVDIVGITRNICKYAVTVRKRSDNPYGLLFYDAKNNKIITTSQVNCFFQRVCKKCNIEFRGQHALRHTFATRCIEADVPPVVLKTWLGHTDIHITLDTYADVFNSMHNSSISKLGDYINNLDKVS